ncbi:MAG TPA: histidine kinase [Holophagaceae bacterium]
MLLGSLPFIGWRIYAAPTHHLGVFLTKVLGPLLLLAIPILFSPWVWRLAHERRARSSPWKALGYVLPLLGAAIFAMDGLDWLLYRLSGLRIPFGSGFASDVFFYLPAYTLSGFFIDRHEQIRHEHQAALHQARQAQARILATQLQPHALFNGLSGLAELILKDPIQAEASVRHLSDFVRKLMRITEVDRYTLADEKQLLLDYLDLQKLRFGHRLTIRWDWDEGLEALSIPPLLLQPLVENALKYGIDPAPEGGELVLGARPGPQEVQLWVRNGGHPFKRGPIRGTGLGLRNLRARLRLAYGAQATLSVGPDGDTTLALLRLPLADPALPVPDRSTPDAPR